MNTKVIYTLEVNSPAVVDTINVANGNSRWPPLNSPIDIVRSKYQDCILMPNTAVAEQP